MSLPALFKDPATYTDDYDRFAHRNAVGQLRADAERGLAALIKLFRWSRPDACKQAIEEAFPAPPTKRRVAPVPGSFVWLAGRDRGCERGLCCMYSMWFDPEYVCVRKCTHRCNFPSRRFAHCGPSLFEDSVLARMFKEFARGNPARVAPRGGSVSPVIFSKRRKVPKRVPDKKGDHKAQTPQALALSRPHDSIPASLDGRETSHPKPKRARNTRGVSTVSRIRKCMGSTSFGRLGKKRTEKVSKLPACVGIAL